MNTRLQGHVVTTTSGQRVNVRGQDAAGRVLVVPCEGAGWADPRAELVVGVGLPEWLLKRAEATK